MTCVVELEQTPYAFERRERNAMKKNKIYDCQSCHNTIIGGVQRYRAHLFSHRLVKARFVCQHCPKEFYRRDQYNLHADTHSKADRRRFACDTCGRRLTSKSNLIKHIRKHTQDKRKDHKCGVCGVEYCEYRSLVRHIRRKHFNLDGIQSSHAGKYLNETWVERVLSSDVYVVMTKLTHNAIAIKKCARMKSEHADRAKDDDGAKDNAKAKDDDRAKGAKSKAKESVLTDFFFDERNSYYSKAICNYCNKQMLKKSLVAHIRERHLKIKKKCADCGGMFSRRYQMYQHDCPRNKRTAKRRGKR